MPNQKAAILFDVTRSIMDLPHIGAAAPPVILFIPGSIQRCEAMSGLENALRARNRLAITADERTEFWFALTMFPDLIADNQCQRFLFRRRRASSIAESMTPLDRSHISSKQLFSHDDLGHQ